nr:hypothetical protein [Micromonospora tulbaghiae]
MHHLRTTLRAALNLAVKEGILDATRPESGRVGHDDGLACLQQAGDHQTATGLDADRDRPAVSPNRGEDGQKVRQPFGVVG